MYAHSRHVVDYRTLELINRYLIKVDHDVVTPVIHGVNSWSRLQVFHAKLPGKGDAVAHLVTFQL